MYEINLQDEKVQSNIIVGYLFALTSFGEKEKNSEGICQFASKTENVQRSSRISQLCNVGKAN